MPPDVLPTQRVDTVRIVETISGDSAYLEILAKTNEQLSLWWNPYGVMVAALGVLFAVLAIVALVVIWRQGADYQKKLDASIAEYRQIVDALIAERVDEAIADVKTELESATGEDRRGLEERLERLENQRETIKAGRSTLTGIGRIVSSGNRVESGLIDGTSKVFEPTIRKKEES